jgi:Membrane bound FAD containing D-sorbitol dehydrogenase
MRKETQDNPNIFTGPTIDRRGLLRGVAAASAAASSSVVPLARAKAEIWEEGDQQCRPLVQEKAPDYDINDALLLDFMKLSETLTGMKSLDRRLGVQYLERYARNPDLSALLPQLIKAYRDVVASNPPPDDLVKNIQKIMQDKTVGPAAEQLIYLWYVSAFFLPPDHSAANRNWLYGSPEQYEQSLLWPLVRGHAPMTRGGDYGYWEAPPPPATI